MVRHSINIFSVIAAFILFVGTVFGKSNQLVISCTDEQNDIVLLLSKNGYQFARYSSPLEAVKQADVEAGVLLLSDDYPFVPNKIDERVFELAKEKKLKLYIEFSDNIPGVKKATGTFKTEFERVIVISDVFGEDLKPIDIL